MANKNFNAFIGNDEPAKAPGMSRSEQAAANMIRAVNLVGASTVVEIPIESIVEYRSIDGSTQPFKVREEDVARVASSIQQNGVIQPVVVCQTEDVPPKYMLIAGHVRTAAAKLNGKTSIEAIVRTFPSKEAAEQAMLDSNIQRQPKPSELCSVYDFYMKYRPNGEATAAEVAKKFGISLRTMHNYRLLKNCVPEAVEAFDNGVMNPTDIPAFAQYEADVQQAMLDYFLKEQKETHISQKMIEEYVALRKFAQDNPVGDLDSVEPFLPEESEKKAPADKAKKPVKTSEKNADEPDFDDTDVAPDTEELPVHREKEFDAMAAAKERMSAVKAVTAFSVTFVRGDETKKGIFLSPTARVAKEAIPLISELYEDVLVTNAYRLFTAETSEEVADKLYEEA